MILHVGLCYDGVSNSIPFICNPSMFLPCRSTEQNNIKGYFGFKNIENESGFGLDLTGVG